jgi:hypothetical protein
MTGLFPSRARARARRHLGAGAVLALGLSLPGCDPPASPPPPAASATASVAPPFVPPPPDGCARAGALDGVEADPACVARSVDDSAARDAVRRLTLELAADSPTVAAGAMVVVRLSITNSARTEAAVVLDASPPLAQGRPDWTRLAGVPELRPAPSGTPPLEGYRLSTPLRTLDANERAVDALPSTPASSAPPPRPLKVRLRPGASLTRTFSFWALRIPAPAPITRDDAGHRFVPKTTPVPLAPGEYVIAVDLPLHGLSSPETTVTTRVRVERPADPEGAPLTPPPAGR